MEASRFGFGRDTPPVFKFDPTDADLVASYLLPRALGLPNPHAHAIIEDDPGSVPPWEILARHGHVAADDHVVHAFFFGPPADASHNGGRKSRTVQGGGVWQGQKGTEETVTLLSPDGAAEVDVVYKKYNLTFARTKGGPSSGYVMHEFEILSPPLPGAVLTRIRAKKGAYRPPGADGAHEQQAAFQVPDPSYEGFAGAQQDGALYDDSNGGGGNYHIPLQYVPACGYGNNYSASIQDQPGTSYNYNGAAMMDNGEGFTGSQLQQAQAFYGAGMVQADGGYYYDPSYVPECGAEFSNYNGHGDYQQWQYQPDPSDQYQQDPSNHCQQDPSNHYQQDPSNHYQAGDAPVMYAGSEGFMVEQEQQTGGPPCGNSDKDSPVGTDASARSTISLCGDDEGEAQECDDTTFFNELLGMGDFVKREQNDAGQ